MSASQLGTLTIRRISVPLPVELLTFAVTRQEAAGLVQWATASKKNNALFVVESSVDEQLFQQLG